MSKKGEMKIVHIDANKKTATTLVNTSVIAVLFVCKCQKWGIMEKSDIPLPIQSKISIIIDEVYSNILYYSKADYIKISCTIQKDKITLACKDNGVKYNPLEKPDADTTASIEEREAGGLGILIIKKMMDNVTYKYLNSENVLIIDKNL